MRKFKKRRRKLHTRKIFLLNSILVVFMFLGIGYSLLSTELTIDGSTKVTEYFEPTLYNVLYKEAKKNGLAKEYTGSHQDSMNASLSTEKIYHWYANNNDEGTTIQNKNNVIFANHCWQMIRTTDTGGVKMIYNGEPENGKCLNTRETHVGYATRTSQFLDSNYWYGTDYTYDANTKLFKIAGTTEQAIWDESMASNFIGKYTCRSSSIDGTCSTLYVVESDYPYDIDSAYVLPLKSNSHYSQFGELQFSENDTSPAYVGYMYGDVYKYENTQMTIYQDFSTKQEILTSYSLNTSYWYADSMDYGNVVPNKYSLVNPYQVSSTADYPSLVGKYTFKSTIKNYTHQNVIYYIAGVNNNTMYVKELQLGNSLSTYEPIVFGDSITDNGNGTYTINNPVPVSLSDWCTDYANYKYKYTCNDSSLTCANPRFITTTTIKDYSYLNATEKIMLSKDRSGLTLVDTLLVRKDEWYSNYNNYSDYKYTCDTDSATCTESNLRMIHSYNENGYRYAPNRYYGTGVSWNGTNYELINPIGIENYSNLNNVSTHHYMCLSYGLKECQEVAFIIYDDEYHEFKNYSYITLKDGVTTISQALSDMLTKNTNNSLIKKAVDMWYNHTLLDYDDFIEDTIFCSDRNIITLGPWDDNGDITGGWLEFTSARNNLSCPNITDRLSIFNSRAHLTYKVGLMSLSEINLMNNRNASKTGKYYRLITPDSFTLSTRQSYVSLISIEGGIAYTSSGYTNGVRPAISLKPKTEYSSGDGSMENPYIVAAEAHHYVYSTSDENTKGTLVSELGSTYRTGIEAINGFNKRVVLNHRIENDRVTSSGVTFERNGIIYTLYGEGSTYNDSTGEYNDDSIYYEENKQTLKYAFGEENCTEYTTPEKYYECTDGNEVGVVRASGRVGVEINHWYCRDFQDGTFHCRQY